MRRIFLLLPLAAVVGLTGAILFVRPELLIVKAPEVADDPNGMNTLMRHSSEETATLISKARTLADQSHFRESIDTLDKIEATQPSDVLAISQLRSHLSMEMLKRAQDKYNRGDITGALEIGRAIPPQTGAFTEFQSTQEKWVKYQTLLVATENFVNDKRCTAALNLLSQVDDPVLRKSARVQALETEIHKLMRQMQTANAQ